MTGKSTIQIVFGTGNIGDKSLDPMARFDTQDEVMAILDAFYDRGHRKIDTARGYSPHAPGTSEPRLGAVEAGNRFAIDSKASSQEPRCHSKEKIAKSIDDSLTALKIANLDIEYLHHPDRATPFEETCEAMDNAYREGKFKRFGLSNYTASEVKSILEVCERRRFVKPSVHQGQYNPIVRGAEKDLIPLLREHGISFYAWSPAGGGFFSKNYKHAQPGSRFDKSHSHGQMYYSAYVQPTIEASTDRVRDTAARYGIGGHAAALRRTVYHSSLTAGFGDAVVIGASSPEQLQASLRMVEEGHLPQDVVNAMDSLYQEISGKSFEIPYHF